MSNMASEKGSDTEANAGQAKPVFLEGGFKAWMAVVACWCVMFNTFGYINAFG